MSKQTRPGLILAAKKKALQMLGVENSPDYQNRLRASNSEFVLSEIQTEFQATAYTYFLAGRISMLEFRACLYFENLAMQNLLFEMLSMSNDLITLPVIKKMTGLKLSEKQFNNMVEFIYEYKSWKTNKEHSH